MATRLYPLAYTRTNLAASLVNSLLNSAGGAFEFIIPWPSDIVAMQVSCTDGITAGSATFKTSLNGEIKAFPQVVLDSSNNFRNEAKYFQGALDLAEGDLLEVVVSTTSGFAPTTTDVTVVFWCLLRGG